MSESVDSLLERKIRERDAALNELNFWRLIVGKLMGEQEIRLTKAQIQGYSKDWRLPVAEPAGKGGVKITKEPAE